MNWLIKNLRPGIRRISDLLRRKDPRTGEDVIKCPKTGMLVLVSDLEQSCWVDPYSGYHFRVGALERLRMTFDRPWESIPVREVNANPLGFRDRKRHSVRIREARKLTGMQSAITLGFGTVDEVPMVIAAHDFRFAGGSVGVAEGEAVIAGFESAIEKRAPFVIFTASGGARLQEGILAVMQLARTTIAREKMQDARLPYIVVLTNPTMGGVTASYGMLGDIHIAEPEATIGFAGRRVIIDTLDLPKDYLFPPGFQTAESVWKQGMLDMIVDRRDMRPTLARLCRLLLPNEQPVRA